MKLAYTPTVTPITNPILFYLCAEIFLTTKYNTCTMNFFVACLHYNLCKSVTILFYYKYVTKIKEYI